MLKRYRLLSHFSASSLWCTDMLCGTSPHLWPLPIAITMAIAINVQLASSWKIKSILCFPESSVVFQKKERGAIWKSSGWYSANWAHFYASTVPGFSGLYTPDCLVDLFVLSNVFVALLPRQWVRGFCSLKVCHGSGWSSVEALE